ncbi:hypothetical protein Ancab_031912 [Ancistrocladus abbreviatus]
MLIAANFKPRFQLMALDFEFIELLLQLGHIEYFNLEASRTVSSLFLVAWTNLCESFATVIFHYSSISVTLEDKEDSDGGFGLHRDNPKLIDLKIHLGWRGCRSVLLKSSLEYWGSNCCTKQNSHHLHDQRRYVGNEARAEERDKGANNVGALIAGQQSGDGDLHEGQRLRDEWETPISSLRREKGRMKKNKRAPELQTTVSVEDQNVGCVKEGGCFQPIMEQAHSSKADQLDANNSQSSPYSKKTQATLKGESGFSRTITE